MRLIWAIDIILFTIFFSSDPTLSCQKLLISWLPYHIYLMYLSSRPLPFCASARQLLFQKLPTAHRDYSTSARFWCTPRCIEADRKQKNKMPGLTEKPWFFDLFFCASEQSIVRTSVLKHRLCIAGINKLAAVKIYIANLMLFLYIRFTLARLSIGMKWLAVIQLLIEPF